ncbi:MAG: hypothetical protein K5840_07750 [Eubacterium sp.]|nr:hypothetical protein [Eubacterium sp.]
METLTKEEALKALEGKKIPILPLDHNYHQLFLEGDKTPRLAELEAKIDELLKHQGTLNAELEELRIKKKETMESIVSNMHEVEGEVDETAQMDARSQTINGINDKIAQDEDELLDLPYRLDEVNRELMAETMVSCFDRMHSNVDLIAEINEWIADIKVELKQKIIRKQNLEVVDRNMFTYMNWIFGEDVYQIFDIKEKAEESSDADGADGSFKEKES